MKKLFVDYTGYRVGTFVVKRRDISRGISPTRYLFVCEKCGHEVIGTWYDKSKKPNCWECRSLPTKNIKVGSVFGKLTVIEDGIKNERSQLYFLCECKCRRRDFFRSSSLLNGQSNGCSSCNESRGFLRTLKKPKEKPIIVSRQDRDYGNIYLNLCVKPKSLENIIQLTALSLQGVQDHLMDLQLEGRIEINKDGLWQTL